MTKYDSMKTFSDTLEHLRRCLSAHGFLETITPVARRSQVPITNRPEVKLAGMRFLRTMIGPALRSTLGCHRRVFEIGPCFRHDLADKTHSEEFVMLDLYAAGESYTFLRNLALTLVEPAIRGEIVTISVADEIRKATGIDLITEPVEAALPALALATECELAESPKTVIDRFIERELEPQTADCAAIIHEFPVGGSEPCARVNPETVGVANRFEIFINGVEVANGYEDEVDMDAFVARALAVNLFDDDQKRIVEGIRCGAIPPAVGMAIGIERLAMAIDKCPEITHYRFASEF